MVRNGMARREILNEAQLAMVRAVVQAAMRRLGKQSAVAAETGIQQQQVSKILRGEKVGLGPAQQLADRGLLDMAALMQERDVPVRSVEREPRYPNRDEAIRLLTQDGAGTAAEVRMAADAFAVALQSDEDLTVLEWVRSIDRAIRDRRRGQRIAGTPITGLGDERVEDTFRNIIKRKTGRT